MIRKKKKNAEDRIRTLAEDLLKGVAHRGKLDEVWHEDSLLRREGPMIDHALALEKLEKEGYATREGKGWRLTSKGHDRALELMRAHRLVETYLARQEGVPAGELHAAAEKAEHKFTTEGINALADAMNRPRFDPHGDPIPERAQDLQRLDQESLLKLTPGSVGRIAHIEDEPRADFEKLTEFGLAVELPIRITDQSDATVSIELAGECITLPNRLAAHVEIIPIEDDDAFPDQLRRLTSLEPGETGIVEFISPACMGPERRRLLDFGMVPGSEVERAFSSPFGSPIAFSLRGTTIGLRTAQARNIFIRKKS